MSATVTTFASILKEFYLGPVQEQLNQEVFVLEMFEKAVVDWNGKHAIVPVHTGRNSGVSFRGESTNLPTAGNQGFLSLQVTAKYQYGRFTLSGPAISAAAKGSANSFISYVDAEMNHLVEDVRDSANKTSITGGRIKGVLCQRRANPQATGSAHQEENGGEFSTATAWEYDGDFAPFANCDASTFTTWVKIDVVRLDTYATYGDPTNFAPVGTNTNIMVAAADETAGTISLSFGVNNASATTETFAAVGAPYAIGVMLHSDRGTDGDGVALTSVDPTQAATVDDSATAPTEVLTAVGTMATSLEPTGVFGNLIDQNFWGNTRGAVHPANTEANASLQSYVVTASTAAAGGRAALTTGRMQAVLDGIMSNSGAEPDQILMSPLLRQSYTEVLMGSAGSLQLDVGKAAGAGSAGFKSLSYAGIPIHTSRAVPNGCIIFLKKDTWKIMELEKAGFADLDGDVLSRVAGQDAYEGYYRWYWNLTCTKPSANGVLCGITLNS
jgi:hypothetical protein